MKSFGGEILFLNKGDINTDEIIPAKYLTEITKEALKPNLLEDLELPTFDPVTHIAGKSVVVSRHNFGCGSSREHAPWAFEVNGINVVLAESFARIFRQNMFNCGMMAIELEGKEIERLFTKYGGKKTEASFDLEAKIITFKAEGECEEVPFSIGEYDEALVRAGGWVEYADANY